MNFEKYKNLMEYPYRPHKPFLERGHTSNEARNYTSSLRVYESLMVRFREGRQKYHDEGNRLNEQFKQDAFKELSIQNNEKKEKLWSKAWEEGHSGGLNEVWIYMQDLVELIS